MQVIMSIFTHRIKSDKIFTKMLTVFNSEGDDLFWGLSEFLTFSAVNVVYKFLY